MNERRIAITVAVVALCLFPLMIWVKMRAERQREIASGRPHFVAATQRRVKVGTKVYFHGEQLFTVKTFTSHVPATGKRMEGVTYDIEDRKDAFCSWDELVDHFQVNENEP